MHVDAVDLLPCMVAASYDAKQEAYKFVECNDGTRVNTNPQDRYEALLFAGDAEHEATQLMLMRTGILASQCSWKDYLVRSCSKKPEVTEKALSLIKALIGESYRNIRKPALAGLMRLDAICASKGHHGMWDRKIVRSFESRWTFDDWERAFDKYRNNPPIHGDIEFLAALAWRDLFNKGRVNHRLPVTIDDAEIR